MFYKKFKTLFKEPLNRQSGEGLKEAGTIENSPDGCDYPFFAGVQQKRYVHQQEIQVKNSEVWLKKKSQLP